MIKYGEIFAARVELGNLFSKERCTYLSTKNKGQVGLSKLDGQRTKYTAWLTHSGTIVILWSEMRVLSGGIEY